MRLFAALYERFDRTTSTNAKVAALIDYFSAASAADAAWALYLLTGQRLGRLLPSAALRAWAERASGIPGWLIDESYEAVGDAAETIALVLDVGRASTALADPDLPLSAWIETRILPLRHAGVDAQERDVIAWWRALDRPQ